jgi:hypothetical protein
MVLCPGRHWSSEYSILMFQEMSLLELHQLLQWETTYLNSDIFKILKEQVQVCWKIKHGSRNLMFCWPCIIICQCNRIIKDALFTVRLFRLIASTCFEHYFAHRQEVLYIQQWVYCEYIMSAGSQHNMLTIFQLLYIQYLLMLSK